MLYILTAKEKKNTCSTLTVNHKSNRNNVSNLKTDSSVVRAELGKNENNTVKCNNRVLYMRLWKTVTMALKSNVIL